MSSSHAPSSTPPAALTSAEVAQLVRDAIRAGLARPDWRDLLLHGATAELVASLPHHPVPGAQLAEDVAALNKRQADHPTTSPPLADWLRWATVLLRPLPEAVRFEQWSLRVSRSLAAPYRRRVAVPERPSACLGRDRMISRVLALLQQRPVVVALTGPPGCGKTTIAREVLARMDTFPGQSPFDLVVWVSASSRPLLGSGVGRDTADRLRNALARALGQQHLRASDGRQVDAALVTVVRAISTLVVLDDVEVDDELRMFLGTVPVSALLTSSDPTLDFHHVLRVKQLPLPTLASIAAREEAADPAALAGVETPLQAILAALPEDAIDSVGQPIPTNAHAREALGILALFRRPPTREMLKQVFAGQDADLERGIDALVRLRLAEEVRDVGGDPEAPPVGPGAKWIDVPSAVRWSWERGATSAEQARIQARFCSAFSGDFWRALGDVDRERFFWHRGLRLDLVHTLGDRLDDILHAVEIGLATHSREAIDLGVGIIHIVWEMGWPQRRIELAKRLIKALQITIERGGPDASETRLEQSRVPLGSALAWCRFDGLGWAHAELGDIAEARAAITGGFELAAARQTRLGRETLTLNFARYRLGDFLRACGELRRAMKLLLACWRQGEFPEIRGASARALGRLCLERGDRRRASQWFHACYHLETSAKADVPRRYAARAQIDLAFMMLEAGDFERAEAALAHAYDLTATEPLDLRTRARAALGRGRLYRLTGREFEARQELETSAWQYRQVGAPRHLAEVEWERSQLGPFGR